MKTVNLVQPRRIGTRGMQRWVVPGVFSLLIVLTLDSIAQPSGPPGVQSALSAFSAYVDLRVRSVERSLDLLCATTEVQSLQWERMRELLRSYEQSEDGLVVWYMRPDGTYYTPQKGRMEAKLSDRSYFPELLAGRRVIGSLVVSKSTGQRSAIFALPLKQKGKVVGAIGASLFLETLAEQTASALSLPAGQTFFALAPDGRTTLHQKTDRHFLDPRELGSESLKKAANDMLKQAAGETSYEYDQILKTAIYRTSPLTQWKFVISFPAAAQKPANSR